MSSLVLAAALLSGGCSVGQAADYGAIAYSPSPMASSHNFHSRDEARSSAMQECKQSFRSPVDSLIVVTFSNGWEDWPRECAAGRAEGAGSVTDGGERTGRVPE